jgi:hypothetical protein
VSAVKDLEQPVDEQPEPETGDVGEPEPEPEPEPTPEPEEPEAHQAPQSEKEIEKANKALDAEKARHTKRISEIMAEDSLGLVPCEACATNIPGFHWPAADFPEGTAERSLYELLAGGADVQSRQPPFLHTCPSCNGLGEWKTGGHKQSMEWLTCSDCGGKSYIDDRDKPSGPVAVPTPAATPEAPAPAAPEVETDMLGRPKGHPNYGLLPIYMNPEQLALDAQDGYSV